MDIKSEILDYINCNENTGALLLTGPWGCGKSFLVKQIAKELNDEKSAAVAVILLFGLDSVSAINKSVKDEYTSLKFGTIGKTTRKISRKISTLIKDGLAVAASPRREQQDYQRLLMDCRPLLAMMFSALLIFKTQ